MTGNFMRAAVAAAAIASTGIAQAVPIYFEFTGSVTEAHGTLGGLEGTAISGGFAFESERLTALFSPEQSTTQFYDQSGAAAYAFLNIADRSVAFPVYPQANTVNMLFRDSTCHILFCHAWDYDEFSLFARSVDVPFDVHLAPDFVGTYRDSTLFVGVTGGEFIDSLTVSPVDIASLPLDFLYGYYEEALSTCPGETFCTREGGGIGFTIDHVSRGVGTRSVPEPGTFGLFAVALAAWSAARRRRARA